MYEMGQGVDRDLAQARSCYENAASLGSVKGQSGLGRLLLHAANLSLSLGTGPPSSPHAAYSRALHYLRLAAASHEPLACYELGLCYLNGVKHWDTQVVAVDKEAALGLLSMAADVGKGGVKGGAAVTVGNLYYAKGTEGGMREARRYYLVAAEEGNVEGMNR
jgi:TPR repeat protein